MPNDSTSTIILSVSLVSSICLATSLYFFKQFHETVEAIQLNLADIAESSRTAITPHIPVKLSAKEQCDNIIRTLVDDGQKDFARNLLDLWNSNHEEQYQLN